MLEDIQENMYDEENTDEEDIASLLISHKKKLVRLSIVEIKRHITDIDLEEI